MTALSGLDAKGDGGWQNRQVVTRFRLVAPHAKMDRGRLSTWLSRNIGGIEAVREYASAMSRADGDLWTSLLWQKSPTSYQSQI